MLYICIKKVFEAWQENWEEKLKSIKLRLRADMGFCLYRSRNWSLEDKIKIDKFVSVIVTLERIAVRILFLNGWLLNFVDSFNVCGPNSAFYCNFQSLSQCLMLRWNSSSYIPLHSYRSLIFKYFCFGLIRTLCRQSQ